MAATHGHHEGFEGSPDQPGGSSPANASELPADRGVQVTISRRASRYPDREWTSGDRFRKADWDRWQRRVEARIEAQIAQELPPLDKSATSEEARARMLRAGEIRMAAYDREKAEVVCPECGTRYPVWPPQLTASGGKLIRDSCLDGADMHLDGDRVAKVPAVVAE